MSSRSLDERNARVLKLFDSLAGKAGESSQLQEALSLLKHTEAELETRQRILEKASLISEANLKGEVTYANERFCSTSGYTLSELLGKPHSVVRHPDMPAELFKNMWQTIGRGEVWQGEIKNRKKDGSAYWVIATVAPVMGSNGKPASYISVRFDITTQKEQEHQLLIEKNQAHAALRDNVNYTRKIHAAVLPKAGELTNLFPENYLYYRPHSIISGDFYWFTRVGEHTLFVLGDSTGHGVSAGFVSLLAVNALRKYTEERNLTDPASILQELDTELRGILETGELVRDTIDMVCLKFDFAKGRLQYTGANRPIYLLRGEEVIKCKKQRFAVGDQQSEQAALATEELELQPGDQLYIFSDGITDQLNPQGRKLGTKTFVAFLKGQRHRPMAEQKAALGQYLEDWQGEAPATDDVLVAGLKIGEELLNIG